MMPQLRYVRGVPSGTKPPPGPLTKALAAILRAALADRGKPQHWLSERSGISQRQASRYLAGRASPTVDQVDAMCVALDLDFKATITAADVARR